MPPLCSTFARSPALPRPSRANRAAFDRAVEQIAADTRILVDSLVSAAPPRNRDVEAAKARARAARRRAGSP